MHAAHLPAPEDFPDHRFPFANVLKQALPLGLTPVSAGFPSPAEDYATRWLWLYNHKRPNMALGGITPKQWLAIAAYLYFWLPMKMGDYPQLGVGEKSSRIQKAVALQLSHFIF